MFYLVDSKVVFLVWCFLPTQNNGSNYIYSRVIRPIFLKNQSNIDSALSSAVGTAKNLTAKAYDGML